MKTNQDQFKFLEQVLATLKVKVKKTHNALRKFLKYRRIRVE